MITARLLSPSDKWPLLQRLVGKGCVALVAEDEAGTQPAAFLIIPAHLPEIHVFGKRHHIPRAALLAARQWLKDNGITRIWTMVDTDKRERVAQRFGFRREFMGERNRRWMSANLT